MPDPLEVAALEKRLEQLNEEYIVVTSQIGNSLSDRDRLVLDRQARSIQEQRLNVIKRLKACNVDVGEDGGLKQTIAKVWDLDGRLLRCDRTDALTNLSLSYNQRSSVKIPCIVVSGDDEQEPSSFVERAVRHDLAELEAAYAKRASLFRPSFVLFSLVHCDDPCFSADKYSPIIERQLANKLGIETRSEALIWCGVCVVIRTDEWTDVSVLQKSMIAFLKACKTLTAAGRVRVTAFLALIRVPETNHEAVTQALKEAAKSAKADLLINKDLGNVGRSDAHTWTFNEFREHGITQPHCDALLSNVFGGWPGRPMRHVRTGLLDRLPEILQYFESPKNRN